MAIKEKFGHAVIGTEAWDIEQTLIQIHRPEINLVSAYRHQSPAIAAYHRELDIEGRYMQPSPENRHPGYGVEPAFYYYSQSKDRLEALDGIPEAQGRTEFLDHIKSGAQLFSKVTGFNQVQVMWRLQGVARNDLCVHIDNDITYRGLETIDIDERSNDVQTLWLPDQYIDWNQLKCWYDHQGRLNGNELITDFKGRAGLQQVDRHHMSIHKGSAFANPLFHSSPGLCPELNLKPKTRAILTYDQAS